MMNPKAERMVPKLAMLFVATLLSLGAAELAYRVLFPSKPPMRFQLDREVLRQIDLPQLVDVIEADDELFWRLAPDRSLPGKMWPFHGIISNHRGVREAREIPYGKEPGEIRILFLADSCTFGYGVPEDATFVEHIEHRLNVEVENARLQCINAGVPGYTIFQGWRYFVPEGYKYRPDLVVAAFGWNEGWMWDSLSDIEHYRILKEKVPPRGLRWSRLAHLVSESISRAGSAGAGREPRPRMVPGEFAQVLSTLHRDVTARGSAFIILVWPRRLNVEAQDQGLRTDYQLAMYRFAADTPAMLADLVPVFQEAGRRRPALALFFDEGHTTPEGHRLVGKEMASVLLPWAKHTADDMRPLQ
jgi:lysophospholipase L1-like esterase